MGIISSVCLCGFFFFFNFFFLVHYSAYIPGECSISFCWWKARISLFKGQDNWDYHVKETPLNSLVQWRPDETVWLSFGWTNLKVASWCKHDHPSIFYWPCHVDDDCSPLLINCTFEFYKLSVANLELQNMW